MPGTDYAYMIPRAAVWDRVLFLGRMWKKFSFWTIAEVLGLDEHQESTAYAN